jgi:hypothetical protein
MPTSKQTSRQLMRFNVVFYTQLIEENKYKLVLYSGISTTSTYNLEGIFQGS